MKCKEVARLITYGRDAEPTLQIEVTRHSLSCKKCREELTAHSVIKSLLTSTVSIESDDWEEVRLVNQVKARIQATKESGLGSWESAVISIRGWLVGFAAAAILLLALSGQLAVSKSAVEKDESSEQISSTVTPMTDDLISNNIHVNWPSSEEVENVR